MRRALGLSGDTSRQSTTDHPTTTANGSHPQRRRFVRDGEVPVTVVHRDHRQDDASSASQLDAARQAIRSQAAGRERAERLLAEAQATVRSLQTAIAHERLAKDDAIERAKSERQTVEHALATVQAELAAERQARQRAEDALRDARATISNLSEKLHAASQALHTAQAELATERRRTVGSTRAQMASNGDGTVQTVRRSVGRPRKQTVVVTVEKPSGDGIEKARRRRGRPPKPPAAKPVKWWLSV
jgi:hypothetical protein